MEEANELITILIIICLALMCTAGGYWIKRFKISEKERMDDRKLIHAIFEKVAKPSQNGKAH